jgi:hypothetical protein
MSEDKDPNVSAIELQEEFIQHMERGGRKIRTLALLAVIAGGFFSISYFTQLVVLPLMGVTSQTVNLVDPGLMALEAVSLVLALAWCYTGLRDLAFQSRLAKQIREIRTLQAETAARYGLNST